jgi:hypothetical protein
MTDWVPRIERTLNSVGKVLGNSREKPMIRIAVMMRRL